MPLGRKKLKSVHPHRFSIKTPEWLGTRGGILRTRARLAKNRTRAHYADIHSHPASFECHFQANAIPCRPDKKRSREIRDRRTSARKHIAYSHKCTGAISLAFANLLFTGGGRRAARRGGFISVSAQLLTSRNALKRIRRVERNAPARENFYSEPECWAREVALQDAFKFQ